MIHLLFGVTSYEDMAAFEIPTRINQINCYIFKIKAGGHCPYSLMYFRFLLAHLATAGWSFFWSSRSCRISKLSSIFIVFCHANGCNACRTCSSTFYKTFLVQIRYKIWKNNIFSEAAPNCLAKCFGQPPPDALVKIEITLASTGSVPRPKG